MLKCKKNDCIGCGVCAHSCPRNAIKMIEDGEGFLYPQINKELCVDCEICNLVCPVLNKDDRSDKTNCFAIQLKDKDALKLCASGGAFMGIARTILLKNGIVFGVEDCGANLCYSKIEDVSSLKRIVGSKYYQCSLTNENYTEIINSTKNKLTLVSGTPCMISAIKKVRGINHDNLVTFEILCQGVPNKKVIKKFYDEKEKNNQKKIAKHYFRSKDKYVGRNYLNRYDYTDGESEYLVGEEDPLSLSFQRQIFLRESCYRCKYANTERVADFTAGDLWDSKEVKLDINLGCSVLLCNTSRALEIFQGSREFYSEEINVQKVLKDNVPFHMPVKRPFCRNYSYKLLKHVSPTLVTKICCWKYYIKKLLVGRKSE